MIRAILKRLIGPFLKLFAKWYFSKKRKYQINGIKGFVLPGVFFPHWTLSTRLLVNFIGEKDLRKKSFLELGCGTGMISVFAAKNGAKVVASDINPQAIKNAQLNSEVNQVEIKTIESDLFENLEGLKFDFIVINPPYYPKDADSIEEQAWYCGSEFEYFHQLFSSLDKHVSQNGSVFMILSEDCEIDKIKSIAEKHKYRFEVVHTSKRWMEENYIFSIELKMENS